MNALYTIGNAYYSTGEFDQAEHAYREVRDLSQETWLLRHVLACHRLASIQRIRGKLRKSFQLYEELVASLASRDQRDCFGMSYIYAGMAALHYEWNCPDDARRMLARSMQLADVTRVPMILADAYSTAIPILIRLGELESATQMLQEAAALGAKYPILPETRDQFESCRAQLVLARDGTTGAATLIEARRRSHPGSPSFETELGNMALARLLIAAGNLEEAGALLRTLGRVAEAGGRSGRLVEINLLQARVLELQGHRRAALTSLQKSLELGEPGNYLRTYIDEGEWLQELLSALAAKQERPTPASRVYLSKILEAFAAPPGTSRGMESA